MYFSFENVLFIGSVLLLLSVIVGKTSFRFGIPFLILFLGIGMLAGSEGFLGLKFDNPSVAQFIGIVSLNFILFSGGLDTEFSFVKPVLWQGISLSTLGVLLTALSLGYFVYLVTDFTIYEGLLLGAIVSSTDAAAVFSILKSKSVALQRYLRPSLEMESGSNDPMAYVLTIVFLGLAMQPEPNLWSIIPIFFMQMGFGAIVGYSMGRFSKFLINNIQLDFEALTPVLVVALMFITYSLADFIGGNGFLSVYLSAVYLGNQDLIHKKTILKFFDGVAWLTQIVLFLTLGLLVFPSEIIPVMGIGIVISLFLIFVSRPLSVFISLAPFKVKARHKAYLSWAGLRGAVPIVFATYPLIAGMDKANMIFNIVFFVSVTSVLIQGSSLSFVSRLLKVNIPTKRKIKKNLDTFMAEDIEASVHEIRIPEKSIVVGKRIVELNFPRNALITMIKRGNKYILPKGGTKIQPNDILTILADKKEVLDSVFNCLKLDKTVGGEAAQDCDY